MGGGADSTRSGISGAASGSANKPKPPHLNGTELLPSYHKNLSSATRQFAFFTTSNRDATPDHSKAHRSHSTRALNDKVFFKKTCANIQGHRSSTQLPLYRAQFCEQNREYVPKTLENAPTDRALADLWLKAGRAGGETVPGTKLGSATTSKHFYKEYNEDPRMPSCKPPNPMHIDPNSKSLEKEPMSRHHFNKDRAHPTRMAGNLRGELMPLKGECSWTGLPQVPSCSQAALDFRESIYPDFKRKSEYPRTFNPCKPPESLL